MAVELNNLNFIDIINGLLFAIYFFWGWKRGLLRTLVTPLCFGLYLFIGLIYLDLSQNLYTTFLVIFGGTFLTGILIQLTLWWARLSVEKQYRGYTMPWSRLLGGIASVLWRGIVTVTLLLLLTALPADIFKLHSVQKDIIHSQSYALINYFLIRHIPAMRNIFMTISAVNNPDLLKTVQNSPEFHALTQNPKVAPLLKDKHVIWHFENRNFIALLKDPLIKEALKDKHVVRQLTKVCQIIYRQSVVEGSPSYYQD